jgi:predicted regulator of Ras-like GTPase activity (Roadblock/LC7/MglB family)
MATTTELLAEAEAAYHKLMTGTMATVFVDQNGERIEYTQANAFRLAAYIAELKRRLGPSSMGPMRVWL